MGGYRKNIVLLWMINKQTDKMKLFAFLLWGVLATATAFAQPTTDTTIAGQTTAAQVLETAQRVDDYFMERYADPTEPTNVGRIRPSNLWTRAVYYEGLMALYQVAPQQRYLDYTDRWADFHHWTPRHGTTTCHADDQCCSQTYLDRYMMTGDERMMAPARENLDYQMTTKIGWWTWIDAIQMSMPVYSKMYRATGEQKYIDHAMKMYVWCRDTLAGGLFNTADGLWWRDKDYVPPYAEPDGNPCYWSRGSGWVYAALVRVMSDMRAMPKNHATRRYEKLLKGDFVRMSRALLRCQRADGMWNPSLVSTNYEGRELTGTSLFLYGMSWGLTHGVLKGRKYREACDRAWQALVRDCVHPDGFLGYVQGTGKDPSAGQPLSYDKAPDFEDYGTGCFLLGAVAYARLLTVSPGR